MLFSVWFLVLVSISCLGHAETLKDFSTASNLCRAHKEGPSSLANIDLATPPQTCTFANPKGNAGSLENESAEMIRKKIMTGIKEKMFGGEEASQFFQKRQQLAEQMGALPAHYPERARETLQSCAQSSNAPKPMVHKLGGLLRAASGSAAPAPLPTHERFDVERKQYIAMMEVARLSRSLQDPKTKLPIEELVRRQAALQALLSHYPLAAAFVNNARDEFYEQARPDLGKPSDEINGQLIQAFLLDDSRGQFDDGKDVAGLLQSTSPVFERYRIILQNKDFIYEKRLKEIVQNNLEQTFEAMRAFCSADPCTTFAMDPQRLDHATRPFSSMERQAIERSVCSCQINRQDLFFPNWVTATTMVASDVTAASCLFSPASCVLWTISVTTNATVQMVNFASAYENRHAADAAAAVATSLPGVSPQSRQMVSQNRYNTNEMLSGEGEKTALAAAPLAGTGVMLTAERVALESAKAIRTAEAVLGRKLTPYERQGVEAAHFVGEGKPGRDGTAAGWDNYTIEQIREKVQILKDHGLSSANERRLLFESGAVGRSPAATTKSRSTQMMILADELTELNQQGYRPADVTARVIRKYIPDGDLTISEIKKAANVGDSMANKIKACLSNPECGGGVAEVAPAKAPPKAPRTPRQAATTKPEQSTPPAAAPAATNYLEKLSTVMDTPAASAPQRLEQVNEIFRHMDAGADLDRVARALYDRGIGVEEFNAIEMHAAANRQGSEIHLLGQRAYDRLSLDQKYFVDQINIDNFRLLPEQEKAQLRKKLAQLRNEGSTPTMAYALERPPTNNLQVADTEPASPPTGGPAGAARGPQIALDSAPAPSDPASPKAPPRILLKPAQTRTSFVPTRAVPESTPVAKAAASDVGRQAGQISRIFSNMHEGSSMQVAARVLNEQGLNSRQMLALEMKAASNKEGELYAKAKETYDKLSRAEQKLVDSIDIDKFLKLSSQQRLQLVRSLAELQGEAVPALATAPAPELVNVAAAPSSNPKIVARASQPKPPPVPAPVESVPAPSRSIGGFSASGKRLGRPPRSLVRARQLDQNVDSLTSDSNVEAIAQSLHEQKFSTRELAALEERLNGTQGPKYKGLTAAEKEVIDQVDLSKWQRINLKARKSLRDRLAELERKERGGQEIVQQKPAPPPPKPPVKSPPQTKGSPSPATPRLSRAEAEEQILNKVTQFNGTIDNADVLAREHIATQAQIPAADRDRIGQTFLERTRGIRTELQDLLDHEDPHVVERKIADLKRDLQEARRTMERELAQTEKMNISNFEKVKDQPRLLQPDRFYAVNANPSLQTVSFSKEVIGYLRESSARKQFMNKIERGIDGDNIRKMPGVNAYEVRAPGTTDHTLIGCYESGQLRILKVLNRMGGSAMIQSLKNLCD